MSRRYLCMHLAPNKMRRQPLSLSGLPLPPQCYDEMCSRELPVDTPAGVGPCYFACVCCWDLSSRDIKFAAGPKSVCCSSRDRAVLPQSQQSLITTPPTPRGPTAYPFQPSGAYCWFLFGGDSSQPLSVDRSRCLHLGVCVGASLAELQRFSCR